MDWPQNNVKIWRNRNPENGDTRYKFIVSDEDTSMKNLGTVYKSIYGEKSQMALKWSKKKSTGTLGYKIDDVDCLLNFMFRSLMKNGNFKTDFIRRYNDYLNTVFTTWNIKRYANKYFYDAINVRDEQRDRYPLSWQKSDLNDIYRWAEERPARARAEIKNYFGYGDRVNITFKSDLSRGYFSVNSISIKENSPFELNSPGEYTSSYYKGLPIWFGASANAGYKLSYITVNGMPWYNASSYVFSPQTNTVIEAVFDEETLGE